MEGCLCQKFVMVVSLCHVFRDTKILPSTTKDAFIHILLGGNFVSTDNIRWEVLL